LVLRLEKSRKASAKLVSERTEGARERERERERESERERNDPSIL
jgi:hypothetical protein